MLCIESFDILHVIVAPQENGRAFMNLLRNKLKCLAPPREKRREVRSLTDLTLRMFGN